MTNSIKFNRVQKPVLVLLPVLVLIMIGFTGKVASAETTVSAFDKSDRFQLKRQGDAFIRLDKKTGEISTCKLKGENLICRLAADERKAMQDEIVNLQDRLDKLNKRQNGKEFTETPKSDKNPGGKSEDDSRYPMDEELDKMMNYSSKVLKRFFSVMKDLKKDFEEKGF